MTRKAIAMRKGWVRPMPTSMARAVLERGLKGGLDLTAEARRQSLLSSRHRSEREALRYIMDVADMEGWK